MGLQASMVIFTFSANSIRPVIFAHPPKKTRSVEEGPGDCRVVLKVPIPLGFDLPIAIPPSVSCLREEAPRVCDVLSSSFCVVVVFLPGPPPLCSIWWTVRSIHRRDIIMYGFYGSNQFPIEKVSAFFPFTFIEGIPIVILRFDFVLHRGCGFLPAFWNSPRRNCLECGWSILWSISFDWLGHPLPSIWSHKPECHQVHAHQACGESPETRILTAGKVESYILRHFNVSWPFAVVLRSINHIFCLDRPCCFVSFKFL